MADADANDAARSSQDPDGTPTIPDEMRREEQQLAAGS